MENIFFLVLVAVVGLLRWLSHAAENKRNAEAAKRAGTPPAQETATPTQGAPQTEEERIRKFLEALGVPATAPPPKMQPRQITPKTSPVSRKIQPIDPFPAPRDRGSELPPPVASAPPPLPPVATATAVATPLPTLETSMLRQATATRSRTASEFEVQDLGSGSSIGGRFAPATLMAQLTTKSGLRDVIVLREIFGPPRSMQAIDL